MSPLLPYYFPQPSFREIRANNPASFRVALDGSVKEFRGYEINKGQKKEGRIFPGRWTLRIMVGYGDDLSAVNRARAVDPDGTQHPINAIVDWQKVAYSNSINVEIRK